MPDRELPEHLIARLSAELTAGAPLSSPLPSQARFATFGDVAGRSHARRRIVAAAAATVALLAMAGAGPTQARQWIGQSVGNIVNDVKRPNQGVTTVAPSPSAKATHPTDGRPAPQTQAGRSPEASGKPEPKETPEPSSHESPEPSHSPDGDGAASPDPSDGGDGVDGSGSGGG